MASPFSILKSVLNINHNCIHVTECEERNVVVHRYGEEYNQTQVFVHVRPYKRMQDLCPICSVC